MIKETLKKIYSNIPTICLIITFTLFLLTIREERRLNKLKEETLIHYYNKFCTKYYDVSCDNIKIK